MTFETKRKKLIGDMKKSGALRTSKVISAFRKVKREDFVPNRFKSEVYLDEPLPIGEGQTISQPTTVAIMTEALELFKGQKVLEVGLGSGYQAAIIAEIVGSKGLVMTLERLPLMYEFGKRNLRDYMNVEIFCVDGSRGYPFKAPYDRIIVAAEANKFPERLFDQLKEGGILVIPVSGKLIKVQKIKGKQEVTDLGRFAFVPLIGDY